MARSRNIKPSFFQNEQLGELDPIDRLGFIGLWMVADFKGCLEFRPKRLKVQLLPYDECDFEKIAINLDKSGLIRNYSVQGKRYIKIINFERHQNPHKNERDAGSETPDINDEGSQVVDNNELAINLDKSGLIRNLDGTNPADSLFPLPDSLFPLPDSLFPLPDSLNIDSGKKSEKQKNENLETETVLLKNAGIDEQLAKDFLKLRKAKKAPLTKTALDGINREAGIAGISLIEAITICVNRNWQGFNSGWDWKPKPDEQVRAGRQPAQRQDYGEYEPSDSKFNDMKSIEGKRLI